MFCTLRESPDEIGPLYIVGLNLSPLAMFPKRTILRSCYEPWRWRQEGKILKQSLRATVISNDLCTMTSLGKWCTFVVRSQSLQTWKVRVWEDNVIMYIRPFAQFASWMDFIKPWIIEMGKGKWGERRTIKLLSVPQSYPFILLVSILLPLVLETLIMETWVTWSV